jgi:diguanylate cyclase (GGDEF)-like protein
MRKINIAKIISTIFIVAQLLNPLTVFSKNEILDQNERNFLNGLGEIKMIVDDNYTPISYFDIQTNEYGGIAVDAMKQLAEILDFKFTIIRDKSLSWSDKLDMIKNNKAHVLGGASVSADRLKYGYFTDETYFSANYAIIGSVDNHKSIIKLSDIAKYRIGLIKEISINPLILENVLPSTFVHYFNSMNEALSSLKNHEIDLIADNEAVFIEQYFNDNRFDFEILYSINDGIKDYAFFSPKTEGGLKLSKILNKGMKEIDMELIVSNRYKNRSIFAYYKDYSEKLRNENELRNALLISLSFMLLLILATLIMIKLKNNHLMIMAKMDNLTKIKNRNALFEDYNKREKLNKKNVYFIDLDDFKFINDNYGHSAGDEVLKSVSKRLSEFADKSNIYRMGGDEFLIIIENNKENFGEKLLKIIQKPIIYENQECKVRSSIGYLETDDFLELKLNEIINLADYAMLEAKAHGKNTVLKVNVDMIEKFRNLLSKKL